MLYHTCFLLTGLTAVVMAAVWEPQPAASNAPLVPQRVRIVKQGIEHQRSGDGYMFTISGFHRSRCVPTPLGLWKMALAREDYREYHDFDVNGNGRTDDDVVGCHPFSLARDNPITPLAPFYDLSIGCQQFYGGMTIYQANRREAGFSEDGMNMGEEGVGNQPRRNWTYFHETFEPLAPFRMYMLALWQKHDFMNGGDRYRVTFDDQSEVAYLIMRYHMGMEGFRWVVRDGDQLYISEQTFRGAGDPFGTLGGKAHVLQPHRTRWAVYNPRAPYHIDFATNTTYAAHTFNDVTAVGWYLYKDKLIPGYIGHKWYAVEADAVVHRPLRPSESIAMTELNDSAQPFYMATCETPYKLWRRVHRYGRSNTFARDPRGCVFRKDGDMGSMDCPDAQGRYLSHNQNEPVTDLTLYDMLAWCNALSVMESKEPCYYTDAACTTAFREVLRSPCYTRPYAPPAIFVKWGADGYRLPTPAEWAAAWCPTGPTSPTNQTLAVGAGAPNANGLHDMAGNVWEVVWPYGDTLTPAGLTNILALGGDFRGDAAPLQHSASAYGDAPFHGGHNIGFRLVRRAPGLAPPQGDSTVTSAIPQWVLTPQTKTRPIPARQLTAPLAKPWLPHVALPGKPLRMAARETTFAQWQPVYDWAAAHGYTFDGDGEMGSMAYWGWGTNALPDVHGPDEPVAGVTHNDVLLWLNALSQLEGKKPVYHTSPACKDVYQHAFVYRPIMLLLGEQAALEDQGGLIANRLPGEFIDARTHKSGSWFTYGADAQADGYRLPTVAEFTAAFNAGKQSLYPWGDDPAQVKKYAWTLDTAGLTTHPVGTKEPNALGLYDMFGNVAELSHDISTGYAMRMGASFMDATLGYGRVRAEEFIVQRGLGYPDVGFRTVCASTSAISLTKGGARGSAPQSVGAASTPRSVAAASPDGTGSHIEAAPRCQTRLPLENGDVLSVEAASTLLGIPPWRGPRSVAASPDGTGSHTEAAPRCQPRLPLEKGVPRLGRGEGFSEAAGRCRIPCAAFADGVAAMLAQFGTPAAYAAQDPATPRQPRQPREPRQPRTDRPRRARAARADAAPIAFDLLQNRVHRANLHRDGCWTTTGVPAQPAERWRFKTAGPVRSSPVLADGVVYVGSCDAHVYAINAGTGALLWKYKTGGKVCGAAAVAAGVVYIASEDGNLYALKAADGTLCWKAPLAGKPCGAPAPIAGIVYAAGGSRFGSESLSMSGSPLFGFNATSGKCVWRAAANTQGFAAPATDGRCIYISQNIGWQALDLASGRRVWEMKGGHQNRQLMSMAIASNGTVIAAGTIRGDVRAITPQGKQLWRNATLDWNLKTEMNAGGDFAYAAVSDVAIAHDRVYLGCNTGGLYTFDLATGKRGWTFFTPAPVMSSPGVAGRVVYFGCVDGNLYAVDALSGAVRWKHACGSPISHSAPWPANNLIVVGTEDGTVIGLGGGKQ